MNHDVMIAYDIQHQTWHNVWDLLFLGTEPCIDSDIYIYLFLKLGNLLLICIDLNGMTGT